MSRTSVENLEVLGKNASAQFRSGKAATLTEAVTNVVKEASLLPEQVRRVVEYANTDAFLAEFRKEGSSHRVIEFCGGPANPFAVLQSLNHATPVIKHATGVSDYDQPPTEKIASDDHALRELFAEGQEKVAYAYADPLTDAYDAKVKLAAAEEMLTSQLNLLEGAFRDLADRLYGEVKQAALEGVSLGDIVQAWSVVPNVEPGHVKAAFAVISPRLYKDGVFDRYDAIGASLQKCASDQIVNTAHPLVTEFGEFCETLSKLAETRMARDEISDGLSQVTIFLKHAADPGLIQKIYGISGRAGQMAGAGAEKATRVLLGPQSPHAQTVGKVVHKAVEHLPTAGALIAGNEVRRMAKYNPLVQDVKNTALQVVPGTPQYQQREYELAAGGSGMPMGY